MEQRNCRAQERKGKHLTMEERIVIERMSRGGRHPTGHRRSFRSPLPFN